MSHLIIIQETNKESRFRPTQFSFIKQQNKITRATHPCPKHFILRGSMLKRMANSVFYMKQAVNSLAQAKYEPGYEQS